MFNKLEGIKVLWTAAGLSLLAAGCATGSAPAVTETVSADEAVVMGRFRLIRNGDEVALGDGIFANKATLIMHADGEPTSFDGAVGDEGEFQWSLVPGRYHIDEVGFMVHGEHFSPSADLTFVVSEDFAAVYVGTIIVETTLDSGYYGLDGSVKAVSVENDCDSDCATLAAHAGVANDAYGVMLARVDD